MERKYLLAPSQQVFWALHELFPDSSIGNEAIQFRFKGPLQRDAMLGCIQALARRFDIWRTSIRIDDPATHGEPMACVRGLTPFPILEVDLASRPASERETALESLLRERVLTRFDLAKAPLMKVLFVRIADDDHLLQFVSHHVILDGISMLQVLARELAAGYANFARGKPVLASPMAPASYADFAEMQRRAFASPERETLKFWRETLAGASSALDLPTDHRRAKQRGWRGARISKTISAETRDSLQTRAASMGASVSDVLLSAFALQLQRYGRQSDLLIGVANGNRRDPDLRESFGCLVLTVPVRCRLEGDPYFRHLAHRVRSAKRAAFEHLDPGVDEVLLQVTGAGQARLGSGYRAVFNYMNFALSDVEFEGLQVEGTRPDPGWTAVDLSLDVNEDRGGLELTLEYATQLFERETAQRYLHHFATLIQAIADEDLGERRISELTLMDESEQRSVLLTSNATARPYPKERCLHEIIRESAARHASAPAITNGQRQLTYAELQTNATALAAHLRALGASAGKRVALMLKDPLHTVVGMLATLESGAAYVPIDPALPRERLDFMLATSRPVAIVGERDVLAGLPALRAATLYIDELPASATRACDPAGAASPEDPAYVIFTSGSTGRPKGVVVRHRNVVNQLFARLSGYPQPPRCMLMPHSFSFDAAVGACYWTLASGGLLVLPDMDARRDPAALRALCARFSVSHADLVPSMYEELLSGECAEQLQSLSTVLLGGEACSAALAERHFEVLPNAALYNEYGPTETTVYSTVHQVRLGEITESVPIGKPIANTRCYVLDANKRPAPLGIPGELYIGGDGVAHGYLDDPQRTGERFIADPFASEASARMYRTGDLVRLRADFQIEFLGRCDRQIKIRGYRVELGEIEAAMARCPGVGRAVAVPRQDALGARIDGYVTTKRRNDKLVVSALRKALREELPPYMVPNHLQLIDEIPLTPAGKIDIDRLPTPGPGDAEDHARVEHYIEPRTQTEQTLAQIWSELLGRARVGMADDFFDLGGHSLLAVRMLTMVEARLGVHVSLSAFFQQATISQLAGLMLQGAQLREESLVVPIQTGDRLPFWLPHPVGGHVVFARRLAVHLDPEQPLLGIQAQGLDGHREPLRSIEEMAAHYIELIRKQQPTGPYFIGGHSLGGLISFEIAQRLRAAGEAIGMLALFDTPGPNYPRRTSLLVRLADHARLRAEKLDHWLRREPSTQMAAREVEEYLRYDPLKGERRRGALVDAIERVKHVNELAANTYRPRPYPGLIHVFRAQQTPHWPGMRFDDATCGWAPYAQHVEVTPIDCTHQNMMDEPGVSELGEKLQDRLLACQERSLRAAGARARARQARREHKAATDA